MAIIKSVDKKYVTRVYSGKPGCMCGCNGIYRYPSNLNRTAAGLNRGYAIDDKEINDKFVNRVLGYVNANLETAEIVPGEYIMVTIDGRSFFAFFN
jgi:hypothetical protein